MNDRCENKSVHSRCSSETPQKRSCFHNLESAAANKLEYCSISAIINKCDNADKTDALFTNNVKKYDFSGSLKS